MTGRLTRTARAEDDLILYREVPDGVEVVRYLHGRRNLPVLLAERD